MVARNAPLVLSKILMEKPNARFALKEVTQLPLDQLTYLNAMVSSFQVVLRYIQDRGAKDGVQSIGQKLFLV